MDLLFCHGLESGPHGRKYHAMTDAGLDVCSPDFQGKNLEERVAILLGELGAGPLPPIVGSSFGGLVAVHTAERLAAQGRYFPRMLLLAPALHRIEGLGEAASMAAHCETLILHGVADEVVPIEASRRFAERNAERVRLEELEDDHSLARSMQRIVSEAKALVAEAREEAE